MAIRQQSLFLEHKLLSTDDSQQIAKEMLYPVHIYPLFLGVSHMTANLFLIKTRFCCRR